MNYVDLGLSVLWADRNLGANNPYNSGDYYAFNQVPEYASFTWNVPTGEQFQELVDKCKWVWGENEGEEGSWVKGPNGNKIFLPACGFCDDSQKELKYSEVQGHYWSSTPDKVFKQDAIRLIATYLHKIAIIDVV